MIAGLDTVSEGDIRIGGRRVNDLHPSERDIAMVFQSYALYPNMSVKDNIAFGMEMRKVPKLEREQAVKEVSKTLQIDHLLDRRPAQLSGGQRQRVAMGRALVRKPRIFLFDEPLSNLDAQLRVDMRTEIKKLHQRLGATIVYVTHDQIEAMTLATRIAVMRAGELLQLGSPTEIYNRPANTFVAGFMGSPRMNLIPGTLKSEGGGLHLEVAADGAAPARFILSHVPDATRPYIGREITAGLRPEAISDKLDGGADARPMIEAMVEVTEPTGPDTLAVLLLGGREITARLRPDSTLKAGERGRFAIDLSKLVWFDPASGARVA
jgi:multiple sugar transport system ATP-binding protein